MTKKGAKDHGERRYDERAAKVARAYLTLFVSQCGSERIAAERLGVKQPTVNRILNEENQPQLQVLLGLRKYLSLSLDELLGQAERGRALPETGEVKEILELLDEIRQTLKERLPRESR